jgi:thiamine pyrophosphate-dependent acetolactate synthase large subunit-like protein
MYVQAGEDRRAAPSPAVAQLRRVGPGDDQDQEDADMGAAVYERILQLLEAEGVTTLFGIPDPGFLHMAICAEQRGWEVVAPHHEQAGAFMADAWSRMMGRPGVIFGTQGPGVANLAAAAICAAKENSPTIFIAGQRPTKAYEHVRRGRIQYIHQAPHFASAMKYVGIIERPEQTDEIVREALRRALSGTPGPVYIEIPADMVHEERDWPPVQPPEAYRLVRQHAGAPEIEAAAKLIREARQPVMLVGQGMFTARAHAAVARLAQLLACPVIQTSGCGMFLEGLEDRTFAYGFSPAGVAAVEASDLCIALGTELGEPLHNGVGRHWAKNDAHRRWIYIERDQLAFGVNRRIDVPLAGDLRDIIPQLIAALEPTPRTPSPELDGWIAMQAAHRAEVLASVPSRTSPVHTARFVVEATKDLAPDTILVRDGGAVSIFGWTYTQLRPRDLVWNQNFGHLGTGLPYAIGAQLAVGDSRRVVLITGDSSFLFHVSELETAVRKNLPIVCVVGCDYAWGLEVGQYRRVFGMGSPETEAHWGRQVRLDKTAESFGAYGEFVGREEDIAPAVQRALASGRPAVIHVPIDGVVNANGAPNYEEYKSWHGDFVGY